ncbi:GtrA family protein [Microbacterium pumilum]|uniref:GtrA family protein n=1 Tax=Microbacterium pumilum TaxID=344165 RepID=A0ABN2S3J3_9MICO
MRDGRMRSLLADLARFVLVGGLGLVLDVVVFNLLRQSSLTDGHVGGAVLIAKALAASLAIMANWAGNRWWTFRAHRRSNAVSEAVMFFVVSLVGSGISLLCLAVSHYVLDLTSVLADNVSANVIGLALGSAFRFLVARTWIFRDRGARLTSDAAAALPIGGGR